MNPKFWRASREGRGFESLSAHQILSMHIITGLIFVIIGALITIYSEKFYETFGSVPFAEKYLSTEGGSRLFYKLLGILVTIIGFLVVTNMWNNILYSILSPLFGGQLKPPVE